MTPRTRVGREGFEPPKVKPADLQSAPVGRLGIDPSRRNDSASTSYFRTGLAHHPNRLHTRQMEVGSRIRPVNKNEPGHRSRQAKNKTAFVMVLTLAYYGAPLAEILTRMSLHPGEYQVLNERDSELSVGLPGFSHQSLVLTLKVGVMDRSLKPISRAQITLRDGRTGQSQTVSSGGTLTTDHVTMRPYVMFCDNEGTWQLAESIIPRFSEATLVAAIAELQPADADTELPLEQRIRVGEILQLSYKNGVFNPIKGWSIEPAQQQSFADGTGCGL